MADGVVKRLSLRKASKDQRSPDSSVQVPEGKKEGLRQSLREALSNAGGSAEGLAEVQAVAGAAKAFQEEEYSFDEDLLPALEFMECMGKRPGEIFSLLAMDLAGILASELLGADLRVTAEVLQDMQQRAASSKVASMLLGVLNSVETPKAAKFLSHFSPTLFALEKQVQQSFARSPSAIQQLPESLKMRVVQENELPVKINQQVALYIKSQRRGMVPSKKLSEDLGPLMSLTANRGEIIQNVISQLRRLHRKAGNYQMVTLREPREESEKSSDDRGRPLSHGPDPFLSTLRRHLVLSAIHQQQLKRSAVGDWNIESSDGRRQLCYKLQLATGYGGTLVGTSTLFGTTYVRARVEGGVLRFELHAATVYYCECRMSSDDMTLVAGKWHSKSKKSRGTFTGQRTGRAQFVDNRHVEWDNMSHFIHETERLLHGQKLANYDLRMKDFQPLIKAVENLRDAKGLSASKMEEEISFCLADPYVLQILVDALLKQVVTRTPANGEALSPEAGFLMIMLHVAAQNSFGHERGENLLTRTWNTAKLKSLGYRADDLAAALRCFAREDDLLKSDFRQFMDALWICALQARKQHDERPITTLRLLVAILTSKAFEAQKKTHVEACLQVAAKFKRSKPELTAAKSVDWIDQLLVDWLINTCRPWPNVASVLRVPLLNYLTPLALEDPYVHSRIVGVFKQVYTEFCRSSEEMKWMAKCFAGAIKNEHYDWSWELACTYLPLIEEKRYLHEVWNKAPIGKVFPAAYAQNGDCLSLARQRPRQADVVVISDEPDNVTKPRKTLEAVDSVLGLRVAQTVHQYCKNASTFCNISISQAAAQAMEMLAENYQGMPWICTLAAGWIGRLRVQANADPLVEQRTTLRACLAKRMVYHFDPERADRLTNRTQPSPSVPWVPDFINVKEWRETIYNLANESRGRSSRFVSGLLYEIGEAGKNFDELLTENSTSESFQLFTRKMRELILRVLTVANVDETLVQDDLDALCATATHKQYTYVYSQGILRQLISMCPSQRQPLRCLNQVLTEYHKENHSALRMDLRLSSVGQYPELSQLLHSMCRFGGSPHFDAKDVKDLCHKVEVLIDKPEVPEADKKRKMQEPQVAARPSKRPKQEPKVSPKKRKNEFKDLKDRANTEEVEEGKTEVASSADSWGHEQRTPFSSAKEPSTKAAKETEVSSEAGGTERTSGRTASVFDMPAPSNSAREERDESDPTTGMRGVLETLRSKVFFEALLTRFVDPSSTLKVTPVERHSYARLMALCCHDGLLADPESQSRKNAQKAVIASTKNLEACHILANDSVTSWYRKMPKMMEQQKTVLGCAAVLRWLQCVVLSDKLSGHQLLVRMAQPLTYMILRGGWQANPKKATAGVILKVLQQIMESLPSTATVTAKELREDEPLTRAAQGDQEASLQTGEPSVLRQRTCENVAGLLVFLANAADLRVPVIDLVRSTATCWEGGLKDFIAGFLSANGPPLSRRTCWSMTLLLATKPVLQICKANATGDLGKQVVEFCKVARDAMSHSDRSQPMVVQRRQSDATEAFKVLQQTFEDPLPESRLTPMPKGRSGNRRAPAQALQGKWRTRLGPLEVKGHTALLNGVTPYTIRIEEGVAHCGGYQTTLVAGSSRITWKRTDGSNKQIEWSRC